jgi:sRNA-binding protein
MKQATFRFFLLRDLPEVLGCAPAGIPLVFLNDEPKPLKIGINAELLARHPGADPAKLSRWLTLWTSRSSYVRAVAASKMRFALDGAVAGFVTESERKHTRKRVNGAQGDREGEGARAEAEAHDGAERPADSPPPKPERKDMT